MSEPVARLIEQRPGRARVHELDLGVHILGRVLGADVILDHADVSRHHAELEISPDGARIRDLDSKNGLVVDGRKVDEASLDDGSRVFLGQLELVLEHPGARIDRVLIRGGEPTVRRPHSPSDARARSRGTSSRSTWALLGPALATVAFAVLLILLLVFG